MTEMETKYLDATHLMFKKKIFASPFEFDICVHLQFSKRSIAQADS